MYEESVLKARKRIQFHFPYSTKEWIEAGFPMENYHKHTTWSNLCQIDSATTIEDFVAFSKDRGCKCYFSGEHGYAGEWLYCYDFCKKNNIQFRYSVEAYWVKDAQAILRETYIDKKTGEEKVRESRDRTNCHIVIVARTYNAMRKLNYILSCAHDQGFYYKPRIDLAQLFTLDPSEVYVTSACIAGWKYEDATEIWLSIWRHFKDSFFLEYQAHDTKEQKELNKKIYTMSKTFGIQTIVGLDTHYLNDADEEKRNRLLQRKNISYPEEEGWYMDFPDGKEVFRRLKAQGVLPDEEVFYAMMNTQIFIDGCENLEYDTEFKIPIYRDYAAYSYEERSELLKRILQKKFEEEDETHRTEDRKAGMLYEYGEISSSGTADYFLDNYLLVHRAVNTYHGQLTPTSRGSASSYYTSKLLGFTTMDRFEVEVPIYPERFVTKERILASHQMPDIDYNVASQEPFVKAAKDLFGEHSCYPLLAVGKLGEKSGFKLYADTQGIEPATANEISKSIDKYNETLKQADTDEEKEQIRIEDYITNRDHLKVFNESRPYQGIVEQAKVHACGFLLFNGNPRNKNVVGYGDIRYEIGLIRCHSESTGRSTIVANVEGGLLDSYGYVKDDFLIVDVVAIIYALYESIGMKVPPVAELRKMVANDPPTWAVYANGATCSLNQCERASTTKKIMEYQPKSIKELAAFIAAIRPGFKSLVNNFLARKEYSSGEPEIDNLLKDCFHYMLYQEAVMKIFSWLGIPMKESYDTIKKISKKKLKGDQLKHVEDTLRSSWIKNIGNLDNFDPVYKVINDSARYSFNAPHACAMAYDSLYEAWMKAHYTSKFYEVTLNHYQKKGDKDKVASLIKEAMSFFGYRMGRYEYGKDNTKFTVDDDEKIIYPNLSSVKGFGEKAVADIMNIFYSGKDDFIDIYLSTKKTNINKSVFRAMIKIGYFQKYGSVKKLLQWADICDEWRGQTGDGRKTLSKTESEVKLKGADCSDFLSDKLDSGKQSDKRYRITDWVGIVRTLCSQVSDEEYPNYVLAKFKNDVLGYVDSTIPSLDWRYVLVRNLDSSRSPCFSAHCIKNGKDVVMKVYKARNYRGVRCLTSFKEVPFEEGDILYLKQCQKLPKRRKNEFGKWVPIPGSFDWWITDYRKIAVLG